MGMPLAPIGEVLGVSSPPVWKPGDKSLVVAVEGPEGTSMLLVPLDGTSAPHVILPPGPERTPEAITPDGKRLIYSQRDQATGLDLWALTLDAPGKQTTVRETAADESQARLSPGGRWLAFVSTESGQAEIHVQYMAGRAAHFQVTNSGGCCPAWSATGPTLYFAVGDEVRTVTLPAGGGPPGRSRSHATLPPGGRLTGPANEDGAWIIHKSPPFTSPWATIVRGWQRRTQLPAQSGGMP